MNRFLVPGLLIQGGLSVLMIGGTVQAEPAKGGQDRPLRLTGLNQDPNIAHEKTTVTKATSVTQSSVAAEDKMEDIQSFNTWISLEDGQPGQRGELQLNVFNGWETGGGEPDVWDMRLELEYSPKGGNWLLDNAKFGIVLPFELTNGAVDGNGDVSLTWKQRLLEEDRDGSPATFTIVNELRIPTGYHSSGVDWTVQGVIAKEFGPGTAVFNIFAKSANGHNNLESAS